MKERVKQISNILVAQQSSCKSIDTHSKKITSEHAKIHVITSQALNQINQKLIEIFLDNHHLRILIYDLPTNSTYCSQPFLPFRNIMLHGITTPLTEFDVLNITLKYHN